MANREFIAAKDLPVTEAEEVNVLVVDPSTGELAQKAGANLGGGGGIAYDAVIDLGVYSDTSALSDLSGGSVPTGTVAMITEKVNAGEMPKIKGVIAYSYYDQLNYGVFEFTAFGTYGSNQVRGICDVQTYSGSYRLQVYMRDDDNGDGVVGDRIVSVTVI